MGAPKQKWTPEEEAALKAGVSKHGAGKWRTILTDAEFSSILCLRSNVDLKDKWRNINVTAIWGSRQKAKLALRKNQPDLKPENNPLAVTVAVHNDEVEIVDANNPIDNSNVAIDETLKHDSPKQENVRLDKLILQAIASLKEPRGSDRSAIAMVIEGQYWTPPDLKKMLASKLKHMAANGKLIKMKHRYKIPPSSRGPEKRRSISKLPVQEGTRSESPITPVVNVLSKAKVDQDLETMRNMATAKEAAAAAAQAVAEAEAAMAAAEEAEREAEAAEAEAEAAQIFAKAAIKAFKSGLRIW